MAVSGVRSSWLASAANCRIRLSDRRAVASDSAWALNAASMWASMMLSDRPRLPTSVRGSRSGTRRLRSPAAIAPAVCSISASGRMLVRTTATPMMARTSTTTPPTIRSMLISCPMVWLMSPRFAPTTRVPGMTAPVFGSMYCTCSVNTRQAPSPASAGTVTSRPAFALSQAVLNGTRGRLVAGVPGWDASC